MRLIDAAEATRLYAAMGPAVEMSGGSAANTLAGLAALGRRCAFIGQVADDPLGGVFTHDLRALGVSYDTPPLSGAAPTARCLILVTPHGQRTMKDRKSVAEGKRRLTRRVPVCRRHIKNKKKKQ